ncbi:MAG: hypothetical protein JKY08_07760 [Flavobacteriaceae bacterium]|nr:hypothetical protein [Flavobacteriaceae bacterium]
MAKNINPALFIGLGGTGHKVLLQVKTSLLKNYGEVPPATKLLCFDTDKKELLSANKEIEYFKKNSKGDKSLVHEEIKFSPNEIVAIPITNPVSLLNQGFIRDWVSDEVAPRIGPSNTGAKQIRQMGRFAIFENYTKEDIRSQIKDRINDLNSITQLKNGDYNSVGEPTIHLVFSPGGGTGAGSFIDIVTIIRDISPEITIWGYMVMPEFYTGFPMTTSIIPNSYASLMEIDHLMGQDAVKSEGKEKNKWWSNYPKKPYSVDFTGNGNPISLPPGSNGFFNNLYLFDNISEKGKFIESVEDAYDRIGRILYLMISEPGTKMTSMYSNLEDYGFASSDSTNNKRRNYSSMGISQIILNREFLKKLKRNQITQTIINAYCYSTESIEKESLNTFIDENLWRENNGRDMVIDRLMPRNELKYSTDVLYPSKFKKGEWSTDVKNNVEAFLNSWKTKTSNNCVKIKNEMLSDFNLKIDSEISKYLSKRGGINEGKQFVSFLIGAFNGMSDEMENESNTHKSICEKFKKNKSEYIDSIINEENAYNPIGKSKRVRETTEVFVQHVEKILIENWQITRKETAKLFFDICINSLREIMSQLNNLENLFNEVSSAVERENQKIMNSSNNDSDFERSIHHFYKDLLNENKTDINIQNALISIDFSSVKSVNSTNEIIKMVGDFAETTTAYNAIDSLTVEGILKKLDKSTRKNIINYLDASSALCIDIDPNFSMQTGKIKMEKFGFICVGNKEDTIFDESIGGIYDELSTEGGYTQLFPVSTGDSDKITLIKIGGPFPGSAIKRIQKFKDQYVNSGSFHHSDIYFSENALDLIDGANDDDEEGLKWFTVGSALGKIYLDKGAMIIEMENGKKAPLYTGNKNKTKRNEALKVFVNNKEYTSYIDKIFNDLYDTKGKPFITEEFVKFYNDITTVGVLGKIFDNIDRESEEYENIFSEKKSLKEFSISLKIGPEKFE